MAKLMELLSTQSAGALGNTSRQPAAPAGAATAFHGLLQEAEKGGQQSRVEKSVAPDRPDGLPEADSCPGRLERNKGRQEVAKTGKEPDSTQPYAITDANAAREQVVLKNDPADEEMAAETIAADQQALTELQDELPGGEAPAFGREPGQDGAFFDLSSVEPMVDDPDQGLLFPVPALPESPASLQLLGVEELLDPSLTVETVDGQMVARLHQALGQANAPVVTDGLAEVVMPQVIRSMAALVRSGVAELRMQLQPPDLGEIELRVRTTQGAVRAEMMVRYPEIKQLIETNLDRLRVDLDRQGLQLKGCDIGVKQDTLSDQAENHWQRSASARSRTLSRARRPTDEASPAVVLGSVGGGNHAVDYTI